MYRVNEEPAIDELLSDPIMLLILRRDGLTPDALYGLIAAARAMLHRGESMAATEPPSRETLPA